MSESLPDPLRAMADDFATMTPDELEGLRDEFLLIASDPGADEQEQGFALMAASAANAELMGASADEVFTNHLVALRSVRSIRVNNERRHTARRRVESRRRNRRP